MKKFKKFISLVLSCAMVLSLCIPAFAAETDPVFTGPYADLKTSIYQQLKAQNKLDHFELQLAAVLPQEVSTQSTSRVTRSWNAPKGGVLCYTYDWTYRGESGYVAVSATYMDPNASNAYFAGAYGTVGALIEAIAGPVIGKIPMLQFMGDLSPIFITIGIAQAIQDLAVREHVRAAGGYGRLSVVYDSISGGESVVLLGWNDHPTITLDWDGAYNISFNRSK